MPSSSNFSSIFTSHRDKLYSNQDEWKQLMETGHPGLVPLRESMLGIGADDVARCSLCYVPQTGYNQEVSDLREKCELKDFDAIYSELEHSLRGLDGEISVDRRSKRNELFCNCCDIYIQAFPGGADVDLPILITDVRKSTAMVTRCTPAEGAVLGLELRRQVSQIATKGRGYMLQDRGDGFMHSFPYGFAPQDTEDRKSWALSHAVHAAVTMAEQISVPSPGEEPLRLGVGLSHGSTYVGAPDIDILPNQVDMILVLGSATATVSARLSDIADAGSAVVASDTFEGSGIDAESQGWKIEEITDAIVPAVRLTP